MGSRHRLLLLLSDGKPNDVDLLDQMLDWVPDEKVRNMIFVDNPAASETFSPVGDPVPEPPRRGPRSKAARAGGQHHFLERQHELLVRADDAVVERGARDDLAHRVCHDIGTAALSLRLQRVDGILPVEVEEPSAPHVLPTPPAPEPARAAPSVVGLPHRHPQEQQMTGWTADRIPPTIRAALGL